MIDAELLKSLCCPETHQPLKPADAALVQQLNAEIQAGKVLGHSGKPVSQPCEGGFVREDGRLLYPIRQGIPMLLISEAIPVRRSLTRQPV